MRRALRVQAWSAAALFGVALLAAALVMPQRDRDPSAEPSHTPGEAPRPSSAEAPGVATHSADASERKSADFSLVVVSPTEGQTHPGLIVEFSIRVLAPWDPHQNIVTVDGALAVYDSSDHTFRLIRAFLRAGAVASVVRCEDIGRRAPPQIISVAYGVERSPDEDAAYAVLESSLSRLGPEASSRDLAAVLVSRDVRLGRSLAHLLPRFQEPRVRQLIITWLDDLLAVDAVPALARALRDEDRVVQFVSYSALRRIVGMGHTGDLLARHHGMPYAADIGELLATFAAEESMIRERLSQRRQE